MDPQIDTAQRRAEMSHCRQCGMLCKIGEYHPYAACMMFSHCRDGDTVRANLSAVQQQTRRAALEEARKVVKQVTIQAVDAEVRWRDKHAHEEREGIAKSQRSECHLRSLGLSIKAALDRLREGVEG